MADSPPKNWDDQEESFGHAKEEYVRRSPEIDLNQVASKPDEMDADEYNLPAKGEQWPDETDPDIRGGQQEPHSPLQEVLNRSPSPKRYESPEAKGSPSASKRDSKSPEGRQQSSYSSGRCASPERRPSPSPRKSSPSSEGRRSLSPRKGYSPPSDGGRRRRYDPNRSLSRSPMAKSARAESREHHGRSRSRSPPHRKYGRSRSPPPRDYERSPRSRYSRGRYSPRRRVSPSRYRPRRGRSPRRRPWSPPPNRSTGFGKPGNNLFIAGFSFVTTERDLERKFSRYGHVTDVRIVRDKWSGDSRGFGFLTLERDEDADAAIKALDQTEWNGRVVLVEKAKT